MSRVALVACAALATGCFGYSPSAKRWAYAGNTLLVLGGGAAIAADLLASKQPCVGPGCAEFEPPVGGMLVVGTLLATAGLVGMIINATRPTAQATSR
jgi:hypothetical protein